MDWKKRVLFLFFTEFVCFSMAMAGENNASNLTEFLGKTINFVVLFGGLTYFLYKPLRDFLQNRATKIDQSLKEAEDSRQEAEIKLKKVRERLNRLEEEIAKIRKEGEIEAQRIKKDIIKDAHREAKKMKHFAQEEIEMRTREAIQELREYTAELATAIAQERIKKKMTAKVQSHIFDKSIEKIEELYERSYPDKEIQPRVS